MDSQMANAVAKLKTHSENALNDPIVSLEYEGIIPVQTQVLERFQPIFADENLGELTEEDFRQFLLFKHNRHWKAIHRHGSTICSDMPKLREALQLLFDETREIEVRLNELIVPGQANQIPYLGRAILTPLLLVRYPSKYGVVNNVSESAMKSLDIWPDLDRKMPFGHRYRVINDIMISTADAVGVDLWTLDALWWGIEEPTSTSGSIGMKLVDSINNEPEIAHSVARFGLEQHLHDFLRDNWVHTELGEEWNLYEQDGDPDAGYEYPTNVGKIDLLAKHRSDARWLVIELKRNQSSDQTVGQVLRYMGWIGEELAEPGDTVHGLIIAHTVDEKIRYALKHVINVDVRLYDVTFSLNPMDS